MGAMITTMGIAMLPRPDARQRAGSMWPRLENAVHPAPASTVRDPVDSNEWNAVPVVTMSALSHKGALCDALPDGAQAWSADRVS